ncbi:MAG TPA: short-chain dehydrogenase [Rhodospirillaceae bacterium]|nr:short-chain dehydrogenase [Rhodospirillaceae bacterium]|tara:strand:+ start:3345 stop:4004 length:660 start_codon:yes stop_codon:yes gene_type:complete
MARVLITGAESGLGLALLRAYTDAGDSVSVLCRRTSSELTPLAPDMHADVDVTNTAAVYRAAAAMGDAPIDVLINNAGIMIEDDIDRLDIAAARLQFEVNALGPLNVALAFRRRLHIGSRVINISSRLGSISDNESGDDYGYRMSKAAQNMLTSNLAIELGKEGICVVAMHPGIVATEMTGNQGTPADEVAGDLKRTIGGLEMARSGSFLDRFGEEIPW